jgi:hypothetical protein
LTTSVLWTSEEIICKEGAAAESHMHLSSYRNARQNDIYYQRMDWEIDPGVKYITGAITYNFK